MSDHEDDSRAIAEKVVDNLDDADYLAGDEDDKDDTEDIWFEIAKGFVPHLEGVSGAYPANPLFECDVRDLSLSDGDSVSSWGSPPFEQSSSADQPIYRESNGEQWVEFRGEFLEGPLALVTDESDLFVVAVLRPQQAENNTRAIFYASTGSGQQYTRAGLFYDEDKELQLGGRRLDGESFHSVNSGPGLETVGSWRVVSGEFDWPGQLMRGWSGSGPAMVDDSFGSGGGNCDSTDSDAVTIGVSPSGSSVSERPLYMDLKYLAGWVAPEAPLDRAERDDLYLAILEDFGVIG